MGMPKLPKKPSSLPTSAPRQKWLSLLLAGAIGFFAAFILLKGPCAPMGGCPAFAPVCPVTSTMDNLENCLASGNLTSAKSCGARLVALLDPSMPELAKEAEPIANAKNIAAARQAYDSFLAKITAGEPKSAAAKP